ncbi:MAG: hypothetical protein AAGU78_14420 [Chloroflexota bacterium]
MTHPPEPSSDTGARLSDHPHPQPGLRRVTGWLVAAGLLGIAAGVAGLLALAIGYRLPLLPLAAVFLGALAAPLLLLSMLHPQVTVYERGLWLKPLIWRASWVPWGALAGLHDHTLIQRGKRTRWDRARDGHLITVAGALPPVYAVVGLMAGLGARRAFGVATHSHRDYPALLSAIRRHLPRA